VLSPYLFSQTKVFSLLIQVECYGPGVQRDGVTKGQRAQFTIDTRRAGSAPLDVQVLDANYNNTDVNVRSNGDGTYTAEYVPKTGSRHTVQVYILSSLFSCSLSSLLLQVQMQTLNNMSPFTCSLLLYVMECVQYYLSFSNGELIQRS
jgi:hypothetical protein